MKHSPKSEFAKALRLVRKAKGLTQEDFDDISSRVYISALERGIKQPTTRMVDTLAERLGVHPLTLLMLAYCREPGLAEAQQVSLRVLGEIATLFSAQEAA